MASQRRRMAFCCAVEGVRGVGVVLGTGEGDEDGRVAGTALVACLSRCEGGTEAVESE